MNELAEKSVEKTPTGQTTPRYWFGGQLLFCVVLSLVCTYVIFDAIRFSQPYLERGDATFSDMPGLGPIVVAAALILLCAMLAVKCVGAGGRLSYFMSSAFFASLAGAEARIVYIIFGSLAVYVFLLFPYLPYPLATFLFLVGSMALLKLFNWRSVLASALFSGGMWFVFGYLFSINLPH